MTETDHPDDTAPPPSSPSPGSAPPPGPPGSSGSSGPPGSGPSGPSGPPPGEDRWRTENLRDLRALRRSRTDRKIAGVAGGLGRHLNMDPTILRVLFVVLVFFGGAGLVAYAALWLLVPEEQTGDVTVRTSDQTRNALVIGALILAGLLAIGDALDGWGFPWGLVVAGVVIAAVLITRDRGAGRNQPPYPGPPYPGAPYPGPPYPGAPYPAAPYPGASSPGTASPGTASPGNPYPTPQGPAGGQPSGGPPWAPGFVPGSGTGDPGDPAPPAGTYPPYGYGPPPAATRASRKAGPLLFLPTVALVALALGVLGLYDTTGGDVADPAYPALALVVIGAMLVLGAFFGRAGGLVPLGIVGALVVGTTAIGNPSYDGERDLVDRPTASAAVLSSYDVPAGRVELDLTRVADPDGLDGRSIALSVNAGEVVVVVPDGVAVDLDAHVSYGGTIETPGLTREGWGPHLSTTVPADGDQVATVDLTVDVDFGRIAVMQR